MAERAEASRGSLAWVEGEVVPAAEARVPLEDAGLLFGHGLFETVRVAQGCTFAWPRHRARLLASASALGLAVPGGAARVDALLGALLSAWGPGDGVLKVVLTAGRAGGGSAGRNGAGGGGALFGLLSPPRPRESDAARRGVRLSLAHPGLALGGGLSRHKTLAYLPHRIAAAHARRRGYDDALLRDAWSHPTECTTANLFWVSDGGALETPAASLGLLPGVGRAILREEAAALCVPCREGVFGLDRLAAAREALVVSALRGVRPVREIDQVASYPAPGPETLRLQAAFERRVAACRRPIPG